jgi:hypothetical protein
MQLLMRGNLEAAGETEPPNRCFAERLTLAAGV